MKTYHATIEGISPYSQSKQYQSDPPEGMTHDQREKQNWREKLHIGSDGCVFIPPTAVKDAMVEAAKHQRLKLKGNLGVSNMIKTGVICATPISLGVRAEDVPCEWLSMNSDGKKGGGKRVPRCFPFINGWVGVAEIISVDDRLQPDMLQKVLTAAGQFTGIGRFRPQQGGYYGRFRVTKFVGV